MFKFENAIFTVQPNQRCSTRTWYVCEIIACYSICSLLARLTQFTEKNTSLKLNDNPLIHGLDEKYAINIRHFFEYIRSDDYRV